MEGHSETQEPRVREPRVPSSSEETHNSTTSVAHGGLSQPSQSIKPQTHMLPHSKCGQQGLKW